MSNQEHDQHHNRGDKPQPPNTLGKPRKTELKKPIKKPQI